jgi:hypothetical protein
MMNAGKEFKHYFKECPYSHIDVYRVIELFGVTHPALQHAIKKLLVAGGRGAKDAMKDVLEAAVACNRYIEMMEENGASQSVSVPKTSTVTNDNKEVLP